MQENSVTVIIPFFGEITTNWNRMIQRARKSVIDQTVFSRYRVSIANNLHDARNKYALEADTEFIIFLDADDELHPNYIEEMLKSTGDIRVPSVHRCYQDGRIDTDQIWYTPKDLMTGNYIVVGAMIRTSLFKQLGGFHDYESLEDWDLWLRAEEAGAVFTQCPEAIYKVHKRVGSRNSNKSFNEILQNAKERRGIS